MNPDVKKLSIPYFFDFFSHPLWSTWPVEVPFQWDLMGFCAPIPFEIHCNTDTLSFLIFQCNCKIRRPQEST